MHMRKFIIVALMVALVSLMIIGPVTAADYEYWDTHFISGGPGGATVSDGSPPDGIVHVYTDTTAYSDTLADLAVGQGWLLPDVLGHTFRGAYPDQAGYATNHNIFGPFTRDTLEHAFVTVSTTQISSLQNPFTPNDNYAYQILLFHDGAWHPVGPMYVIHKYDIQPINADFTYTPEQPWIAPLEVTFTDASTGPLADTITWELESLDGPYVYGYAQAMDEVTWRFDYAGTYQVNLTVTNGSVSNSKTETFTVYNPTDLQFGIQIIDDDIPFGGTTDAELVGGQTGNITAIRWYAYYPGQTAPQDFYESGSDSYRLNYALKDGNWMGWDDSTESFSNNAGATLPNPVTLKPEYSGEVIVGCYVFLDDDTWQNPVSSITVGEGQGLQTIRFTAQDAITNSVISPVQYNIQKLSDGSWTNQTEPGSGQITVNYPAGTSLSVEVIPPSGSDYSTITELYQVENTAGVLQDHVIKMWKDASEDPEFTTANLIVKRGDNLQPIQGATIVLSDAQECTTTATGSCQFTVTNDTQISATITKTGFFTETIYFTPFGASYLKELKIWPIVVSTTPISTIPTTSGPGGAPTPTTTSGPGETPEPGVTYPPGVPMPGTTITYPPGVPVIGAVGSETGNVSAREAAEKSLTDWMLYGSAFVGFIFLVMLVGFSGDALKKWSWIWK